MGRVEDDGCRAIWEMGFGIQWDGGTNDCLRSIIQSHGNRIMFCLFICLFVTHNILCDAPSLQTTICPVTGMTGKECLC